MKRHILLDYNKADSEESFGGAMRATYEKVIGLYVKYHN